MARPLVLYNTASQTKEVFTPVHIDCVGVYCCGPTVYDYAHIGNLRTYIWEDVLVRTLLALGYNVRHVVNITDVGHLTSDADTGEDKIEKGARREGKSAWEIAQYYTQVFKNDLEALNCRQPSIWCRATDHIGDMIAMIEKLEKKDFTYTTSDGIYFDTSKFPGYCDFARLDPESLRAGARIEMGEKRQPTDFALWKFSPVDKKRQMEWDSPWGRGFPGWHIECSAMALRYLPQPVDIHCGGHEHIRVHHTNEIAQAEAATEKQFVRYWIHGEWVMFGNLKMSKSGGGIITLDSVRKEGISPLAYRLFVFSAHHRSPLTFTWDGLRSAAQGLKNLKKMICSLEVNATITTVFDASKIERVLEPFWEAICDDLNTPRAIAALWDIVRDGEIEPLLKRRAIEKADEILGLELLDDRDAPKEIVVKKELDEGVNITIKSQVPLQQNVVETLIYKMHLRRSARKQKDFSTADAIRKELQSMGANVKDLPDGSMECIIMASIMNSN